MKRHGELFVLFQVKQIKSFVQDVFDGPEVIQPISMTSQTRLDEPLVSNSFSE